VAVAVPSYEMIPGIQFFRHRQDKKNLPPLLQYVTL